MRTNLRIRTALALLFVALAATVSIAHPDHGPGSSVRFSHVFEPFHVATLFAAVFAIFSVRRATKARLSIAGRMSAALRNSAIELFDCASRAAFADFVRDEADARACPTCGSTFECSSGECSNDDEYPLADDETPDRTTPAGLWFWEDDDEPTEFERAIADRRANGYDPARIEQAG